MAGASLRDHRGLLVGIVALGVALRLAFALGYWNDQPLTRDEREYLSLARGVASGAGFVYDEVAREGGIDPFGRAPGYPAFLALVGGGGPATSQVPHAVQIAQAVAGGFGIWMVALYASRLAGDRAGVCAAAAAAVYPPLVWISAYAFSEAIFWPLGLAVAWTFDHAHRVSTDRERWRWALIAGLLGGAAVLVRPALLFFFPLAAVYWLRHRRWSPIVMLALGSILVIGPWTVRNWMVHHRLVLVASEGGVTFWTGNHPLATGDGDMAANPAIKQDNRALRARFPDVGEEDFEPIYYREAFAWIRAHPGDWLALQARKVFYLIVPIGPSYTLHSPLYFWASVFSYGLLLPFALAGAWRQRARLTLLPGLWLLVGSAIAVCLVFFPQERFRIPVIDPALLILAGAILAGTGRDVVSAQRRMAA